MTSIIIVVDFLFGRGRLISFSRPPESIINSFGESETQ